MKKEYILLLFFAGAAFLAPKCSAPQIDKSTAQALAQKWYGAKIQGQEVLSDTRITIQIKDWHVSGSSGCNGYSGEVKQLGLKVVKFRAIRNSTKACSSPKGVMQQEARYLAALRSVDGYELSGSVLKLKKQGQTVLTFHAGM